MRTEIEAKNQKAISDFFEAYGTDTAKEYCNSILDLTTIVATQTNVSLEYKDDLLTKLKDLNRLILQLGKIEEVQALACMSVNQIN